MTKLVASILAHDIEHGLAEARRAQRSGADMVEFRLDHFRDPNAVIELVRQSPAPVLAACRIAEDGGHFPDDPELRRRLLLAAAEGGAEWLDLEHWERMSLPPSTRPRILRSYHRLQSAPQKLRDIVDRMAVSGADALKVTVMGYDAADIDLVTSLYERSRRTPLVAFCAGEHASASRFLALLHGAPFLYCSLDPGGNTAPGQPELFDAREVYRAKTLGPESSFWGLLGAPVAHSLGFRLHNGLGRWLRDVPVYLPFHSEQPERLVRALRGFGSRFLGLSITSPHKGRLLPMCDRLSAEAKRCGAINTIVHRDGLLIGENTDIEGVRRAVSRPFPDERIPNDLNALVLGAGGAARAACLALLQEGARVCIAARTRQGIRDFAESWSIPILPLTSKTIRMVRPAILVNATPVGTVVAGPDDGEAAEPECLVEQEDIVPGSVVLDLVYRPAQTELLRRAEAAGAHPVSGLWMFLHQAVDQIEHVLGRALVVPGVQPLSLLLGPEGRVLRGLAPSS